ncbi:hypothetical protein DFS34DRAFT_660958 [Phlyctochytrium arcticum]|nr:hypothetical protein DFS34DRAFT_660958 [Phlyctochytrium arcticum]
MTTSASSSVPRIKRLEEGVVNRIAAGEIIHRPANALKEMIENSLDAGAMNIQITIKEGGFKLLQIQDNGHGIGKDDLPLVCERFATSKLKSYDDLRSIATYGFRGEALASISHVAHVTVTTKTEDSPCAWKVAYSDGKLVPLKAGTSADPKPCAGNRGTQITVEDLFYNVPTRRKALKNATEEYNRILDVVHKYAIHNSTVSFTCKKAGANSADVHTSSKVKTVDNIRYVYGANIAKELIEVELEEDRWQLKASGLVSNANFNTRKMIFLLFINHRSVDSPNLKRAIEALYTEYLPRGTHPFVYLHLELATENVDVNVHPTKREVHFINEDKIIESLCECLQNALANANQSRTFYTQTFLPGAAPPSLEKIPTIKSTAKAPEHKLVRTDSRSRTLDSFLAQMPSQHTVEIVDWTASSQSQSQASRAPLNDSDAIDIEAEADMEAESFDVDPDETEAATGADIDIPHSAAGSISEEAEATQDSSVNRPILGPQSRLRPRVDVQLTSVIELRQELRSAGHLGLTQLFNEHTFVGCVDDTLALVQHLTKLYLTDYVHLSEGLFYQLILLGFSNFGCIRLSGGVSIEEMVKVALASDSEYLEQENMMDPDEIAKECADLLVSRREMLEEYFSFIIDEDGILHALPLILKNYTPSFHKLPAFLLRLGSEVDWTSEKSCFQTIAAELAAFYSLHAPVQEKSSSAETTDDPPQKLTSNHSIDQAQLSFRWTVEHVIFPALKSFFIAPKSMTEDGTIVQLANLPDLYRVFERC